jgi:hypothetical protein
VQADRSDCPEDGFLSALRDRHPVFLTLAAILSTLGATAAGFGAASRKGSSHGASWGSSWFVGGIAVGAVGVLILLFVAWDAYTAIVQERQTRTQLDPEEARDAGEPER